MISYRIPPGVQLISQGGQPLLTTPQGGKIALDHKLLALWRLADGCELEQILGQQKLAGDPLLVHAALCCLAEAGLLAREGEYSKPPVHAPVHGPLVSVVIVGFNSRDWLADCLPSVLSQAYAPLEIILVDNASTDGTSEWVEQNYSAVRLVRLETPQSLAHAINLGISKTTGEYFFLLNPDVKLAVDAIAQMVAVVQADPACAAVAGMLKFLWAPAFLNGLGNYVGAFSWGTDIGLGHLDLGQFDHMQEVPSACFAAALLPRAAWNAVGSLDEGFPLYYEDSDWSYRARLLGFSIRSAPRAVVYHAFSGRVPSGEPAALSAQKLRRVAYGRLRFATKILEKTGWLRFLRNYLLEDSLNFTLALLRGRWGSARAYWQAWGAYLHSIPRIRQERTALQSRRVCTDQALFGLQKDIPQPFIRNGLPQLTWDIVRSCYYPLIISGETHQFPEFASLPEIATTGSPQISPPSMLRRAMDIWRSEGVGGLLHHVWRYTQWYFMRW
jgi:GT2 family glycosyltransferase